MSVAHGSFTIRREYAAPVAMVFNAWADRDAKMRWFAAPHDGVQEEIREQNFTVGGRDRLRARWPDGRISDFRAEYFDIAGNARIVYVYEMYLNDTKISVSLATVTFEAAGKGTKLTVTEQGVFLDGYDDAGAREHGTGLLLDQLGVALGS
jgi:uncharacterized protein YndB with AHSA1/START domain